MSAGCAGPSCGMLRPMRSRVLSLLVVAAFGLFTGARTTAWAADAAVPSADASASSSADASTTPDAGFAPDASSLPLLNLAVIARAIEADGAARELKTSDVNELVAFEARFELEMPALRDVRVRLFDEDDKAVPSTDRLELGPRTRYTLDPTEALLAGSRYALVVDGQSGEYPTDPAGRAYRTVRIELQIAGEKPAPPPGKASKAKKKPKKRAK